MLPIQYVHQSPDYQTCLSHLAKLLKYVNILKAQHCLRLEIGLT